MRFPLYLEMLEKRKIRKRFPWLYHRNCWTRTQRTTTDCSILKNSKYVVWRMRTPRPSGVILCIVWIRVYNASFTQWSAGAHAEPNVIWYHIFYTLTYIWENPLQHCWCWTDGAIIGIAVAIATTAAAAAATNRRRWWFRMQRRRRTISIVIVLRYADKIQ